MKGSSCEMAFRAFRALKLDELVLKSEKQMNPTQSTQSNRLFWISK